MNFITDRVSFTRRLHLLHHPRILRFTPMLHFRSIILTRWSTPNPCRSYVRVSMSDLCTWIYLGSTKSIFFLTRTVNPVLTRLLPPYLQDSLVSPVFLPLLSESLCKRKTISSCLQSNGKTQHFIQSYSTLVLQS